MKTCSGSAACPCGRMDGKAGLTYGKCCGRFLDDGLLAPDAESLMRSRYSAFCLEREAYLLKTWHATQRPGSVEFEADVKWLGLEVRDVVQLDTTHAQVAFVARQKPPGAPAVRLNERSRFVREEGQWLYVDAVV